MARKRARTSTEDTAAPLVVKKQVEVADMIDEKVAEELVAAAAVAAEGGAGPQDSLEGMEEEEEEEGEEGGEGESSDEDEEGDEGDGEFARYSYGVFVDSSGPDLLTDPITCRQLFFSMGAHMPTTSLGGHGHA